jgi:TonB family protein
MLKPRTFIKGVPTQLLCALAASLFLFGGAAHAQQNAPASVSDDLTRGLELYKQGDDKGAIEVLRRVVKKNSNEIAAWYGLALAYTRQGKTGEARKAYEKSAKSGEQLIERIYESTPYEQVPATTEKYKALIAMAAVSSQKYLELTSKPSRAKAEEWNERTALLSDYATLAEERTSDPSASKVYTSREVETKARIISRPEPAYTEEARQGNVTGTIVLRAIFAFDGKVRAIRVVRGLSNGLTMQAIIAARKIKFIPATVNGKPVSQYIQIEYNFHLF